MYDVCRLSTSNLAQGVFSESGSISATTQSLGSVSSRFNPLLTTDVALENAIAQRALDPVALDVRGLSSIADFLVIASATSQRHLQGMSDKIAAALAAGGEKPISISGYREGDWIVQDYGDLIVHLFYEPARQFYNLDQLWSHAPRVTVSAELEQQARRLRTGAYR